MRMPLTHGINDGATLPEEFLDFFISRVGQVSVAILRHEIGDCGEPQVIFMHPVTKLVSAARINSATGCPEVLGPHP
jgi:hypothetical protein